MTNATLFVSALIVIVLGLVVLAHLVPVVAITYLAVKKESAPSTIQVVDLDSSKTNKRRKGPIQPR